MSDKQFSSVIGIRTTSLIDFIAEKYNIAVSEAMELFYSSKTYAHLQDRDFGLWTFSKLFVFKVFDHEQKTGFFTMPECVL